MSHRTSLLALAAVVLALAGCTGGSAKEAAPRVATLESKAAPSSAPAGDQRPVYPLDATDADIEAMAKPWIDCLVKKGGLTNPADGVLLLRKGITAKDMPEQRAAFESCEPRQPESFEDHQLRTNPAEFKDNQREWYRCAQAAGYKLTAPDPETGQFGLTEVGPNGDAGSEKMLGCRRTAFAE
jgi:hypothetical protein